MINKQKSLNACVFNKHFRVILGGSEPQVNLQYDFLAWIFLRECVNPGSIYTQYRLLRNEWVIRVHSNTPLPQGSLFSVVIWNPQKNPSEGVAIHGRTEAFPVSDEYAFLPLAPNSASRYWLNTS